MAERKPDTPYSPSEEDAGSPQPSPHNQLTGPLRPELPSLPEHSQEYPAPMREESDVKAPEQLGCRTATHAEISAISDIKQSPIDIKVETSVKHESSKTCDGSPNGSTERNDRKRSIDSIDLDNDEDYEGYDPANDPPPKAPIYHHSFPRVREIGSRIPARVLEIIQRYGSADEAVQHLREQAEDAKEISSPEVVKAGVTGDSGTGKSSLLNCLLGEDDMAPHGAEGEACTAVVQEFRAPHKFQEAAYESVVYFFPIPAQDKALAEWVEGFWDCQQADAETPEEELVEKEDGSSTAVSALFSLFCDRAECSSLDATKDFLATATTRGDTRILSTLKVWRDELLRNQRVMHGKVHITSDSPGGFREEIAPYLKHVRRRAGWRPSPWPLVRIVRTFFHSPLLSRGVVLADLPGTSDTNQTRVRAGRFYLKNVDHTVIVSNISRIQTDSNTQRYLVEAVQRMRGPSVFMVATHSDNLNITGQYIRNAIRNSKDADSERLSRLRDRAEDASRRLKKIDSEILEEKTRKGSDRNVINDLRDERSELKVQRRKLHAKMVECCILMRNNKVSEGISEKYSHLMRGTRQLPTFCVSNSVYQEYVNPDSREEGAVPSMGVGATGIPGLRAALLSLPAHRQFKVFEHHNNVKLASLLNNVEITFSEDLLRRKEGLQRIICAVQEPVSEGNKKVFQDVLRDDLMPVLNRIRANRREYGGKAKTKLSSWEYWHFMTYRAFCLHKGHWKTRKVGGHNWNQDMLQPFVDDITPEMRPWDNLSVKLAEGLKKVVARVFDALHAELRDASESLDETTKPFSNELRLQHECADVKCEETAEEFERELLQSLKANIITTEDHEESFFVRAMDDTYVECGALGGQGSHAKRQELLSERVTEVKRGPFQKMFEMAKKAATKLTENYAKRFSDEISKVLDDFQRTFLLSYRTDEDDPSQRSEVRKALLAEMPALRADQIEASHLLAECAKFTDLK